MMFDEARIFLTITVVFTIVKVSQQQVSLRQAKLDHIPFQLTLTDIEKLSDLTNLTHMSEALDEICRVRVVGTPGHKSVKDYIKKTMRNLNWTVESDVFVDQTPIHGSLQFENIIAKLNPNANRYLALACHYDSKYFKDAEFVGATDSAVPCSQMLNLATVMNDYLHSVSQKNVSLMMIFFDGEEAFRRWGPRDSIYGARHLATKWHNIKYSLRNEDLTELDKLDMLVLLDLLGAPDPVFYNYFGDTAKWYTLLINAEEAIAALRKFEAYSYGEPEQRYFRPITLPLNIEDDHIPFLHKNVAVLHIIPHPFPDFWHEPEDDREHVDLHTTENLNKIFRVFVASYLHLTL